MPYISDTPTISTEYNETTKDFEFVCQFNGAWQDSVNYTVAFYVDGLSVFTTTREYNATYRLNIANISADVAYGSTVRMKSFSRVDTSNPIKVNRNLAEKTMLFNCILYNSAATGTKLTKVRNLFLKVNNNTIGVYCNLFI